MEGKFVSQSVFNLLDHVLIENDIKVLDKGLNFVLTPEKLDCLQIKNNLEKLGRDIELRMFYQNDLSPSFSEKPLFKVPSSWTPPIEDFTYTLRSINTMNVPGIPIISNNGIATERISSFLDFHHKNIIQALA